MYNLFTKQVHFVQKNYFFELTFSSTSMFYRAIIQIIIMESVG
uniref:Uncharacterized protein n=1 Tax=Arundo donax TaxID=35708 RepID=A0A0A9ALQ9_ARUDO